MVESRKSECRRVQNPFPGNFRQPLDRLKTAVKTRNGRGGQTCPPTAIITCVEGNDAKVARPTRQSEKLRITPSRKRKTQSKFVLRSMWSPQLIIEAMDCEAAAMHLITWRCRHTLWTTDDAELSDGDRTLTWHRSPVALAPKIRVSEQGLDRRCGRLHA